MSVDNGKLKLKKCHEFLLIKFGMFRIGAVSVKRLYFLLEMQTFQTLAVVEKKSDIPL